MHGRVRRGIVVVALALGLAAAWRAAAQDEDADEDSPARVRAELAVLKREIGQLRGRVAQLEAQVAALSSSAVPGRSEVTRDRGFVFPGMPPGTLGAQSAGDLAALIYQAAGRAPADVEPLLAFSRDAFYVPESLWSQASQGLKTVVGIPTRNEIDAVLRSMKPADVDSSLGGIVEIQDAAPKNAAPIIRVIELTVVVSGRSETYRLTAIKINGRWFAAHMLSITAEEEARAFLEDLVKSQRSYRAFYQVHYAKSLRELADDRDKLETSANLRRAGLTFPLGARLDRLQTDKLEWSKDGDLLGPFYRFHVTGDESGGWTGVAIPLRRSYRGFSVEVPGSARIGDPVVVHATGGAPGAAAPDEKSE